MNIEWVGIRNFRCFERLSLAFDPRVTVIVAPNGQGKSSLLDAVKVALWPFVAGFDLSNTSNDVTGIYVDDVLRERVRAHESEARLPSSISAEGKIWAADTSDSKILPPSDYPDRPDRPWSGIRLRNSLKKSSKTSIYLLAGEDKLIGSTLDSFAKYWKQRVYSSGYVIPDDLPMVGYYGTGRLWHQKKLSGGLGKIDNESLSRTFAYRDCLDSSSSYKHFVQWYAQIFMTWRNAQIRNLEKTLAPNYAIPDDIVAPVIAVQQAIDAILEPHTGWKRLAYSVEHQELVLEHDQFGELKVSQLSDGIRNMLALAGDIAYRCYKLNAHHGAEAPGKTRGIVMIDEVDMHLHPEWQQTVVPDLCRAFPLLQFIVTTHSPQVLTSVQAHCIRRLDIERDEDTQRSRIVARTVSQQTLGVASSDALAEVMQIDPVPDVEPVRWLSQYQALIQQYLHEDEQGMKLREKLDAHFGPQHPLMLNCDRLIRLQAFKRKLPAAGNARA